MCFFMLFLKVIFIDFGIGIVVLFVVSVNVIVFELVLNVIFLDIWV